VEPLCGELPRAAAVWSRAPMAWSGVLQVVTRGTGGPWKALYQDRQMGGYLPQAERYGKPMFIRWLWKVRCDGMLTSGRHAVL
jgi:hypothetical protein